MSCKYTECYHWGSCERSKEKPLSSHAVLSDRCRDYQQAINQIEDYFEYRYLSGDSKEIKKTVMDIIDNLVIQIIQPWMFGDSAEKKTCLWLKGVNVLKSSDIVKPPERIKFKSGKSMPEWYASAWKLPKEERAKLRSKTFPGIAKAMAEQWG